jgi:hypothetical protein
MGMAISEWMRLQALERIVAEQQKRMEALEAQLNGKSSSRQPGPLAKQNASRKACAERLHAEIERIAADHPPEQRLTAKHVLKALSRTHGDELPSERTVRLHLAAVRGNGNAD